MRVESQVLRLFRKINGFGLKSKGRGLRESGLQFRVQPLVLTVDGLGVFVIVVSGSYLTQSVLRVVLQRSVPTQIHQLIFYVGNGKG